MINKIIKIHKLINGVQFVKMYIMKEEKNDKIIYKLIYFFNYNKIAIYKKYY